MGTVALSPRQARKLVKLIETHPASDLAGPSVLLAGSGAGPVNLRLRGACRSAPGREVDVAGILLTSGKFEERKS